MFRRLFLLPHLLALGLVVSLGAGETHAPEAAEPEIFPVRMVKLGSWAGKEAALRHLEFCRQLGFNAVWVYSNEAGRWKERFAPKGPYLNQDFLEIADWCRAHGMRVFVSVNPVGDSRQEFVFSDRKGEKRIRKFFRLLRRRAEVRDFVVSFDDQPRELTELRDILRYGRSAAPAHLDLVRRLERAIHREETVWFCAVAYSDAHLGDGSGPYSRPLLEGLSSLPDRVGMVWTGTEAISPSITAENLAAARARLGGRKLLLYDNYPVNGNGHRDALALIIGPLRHRAPGLAHHASVYLACPMYELAASRLALLTIADYLRKPVAYEPELSWLKAMEWLAGPDSEALEALRIQGLEWGGWVGTRNYRFRDEDNIYTAVESLDDPAAMASWTWVVARYPDRMKALGGLADGHFRDELLGRMEARLAVARALPLVREYRARARSGRTDLDALRQSLLGVREAAAVRPEAVRLLDLFLETAGVNDLH